MGIIVWIIVGLVAGLIARALVPGPQPMGLFSTTLLGLAGSIIGGFLGHVIGRNPGVGFHASGLIGSIIGAVVLLFILSLAGRQPAKV